MSRAATVTGPLEQVFLANPNKTLTLARLKKDSGIGNGQAISASISYLNKKARDGKGGLRIETVKRGQSWAYRPAAQSHDQPEPASSTGEPEISLKHPGSATTRKKAADTRRANAIASGKVNDAVGKDGGAARAEMRRLANKLTDPAPAWHPVPEGEPAVSFHVIGSLVETGELVLKGASAGVGGVWLARRAD